MYLKLVKEKLHYMELNRQGRLHLRLVTGVIKITAVREFELNFVETKGRRVLT